MNVELFTDEDAARMQDDSVDLVNSIGVTSLILRQPLPPDGRVSPDFELDPDFKTPTVGVAALPFLERTIIAKVRAINDRELASTGVGELQIGDLVADVDPTLYDDPVRPVSTLDEIRFAQDVPLAGGVMSHEWDFAVHGVHPSWGKDLCVKLRLTLRRKKIQTAGGSAIPAF